MRPHRRLLAPAALVLVLAATGAATAQSPDLDPDEALEAPGDALGVSQNDVRDEPDHVHDDNGFPHGQASTPFSPQDPTLILEAYTEARVGNPLLVHADEDASNVLAWAQHGDDHASYDHHLFPGQVTFEAYWGNWTDTRTAGLAGTDHEGVVDDVNDCEEAPEDEFIWRGPNPCLPEDQRAQDTMLAFVQPGTHWMHINTVVAGCACPARAALANHSDEASVPDFAYEPYMTEDEQIWWSTNGFSRYEYDQSLLVTTKVTSAANPALVDESGDQDRYDPHSPAGQEADHAVDVDVYTSAHPTLEDAYRTVVWDPDGGSDGPLEKGVKGFLKDEIRRCLEMSFWDPLQDCHEALAPVDENISRAVDAAQGAPGVADDLVLGPYKHEPNTPDDDYAGWATHDPNTTYGGLDDTYYDPGPNQTYQGYAEEARFWIDTKLGVNTCPIWLPTGPPKGAYCYNGYDPVTPGPVDAYDPADTPGQQDETTQGPTFLYLTTNAGDWHDQDGDTWVGTAPAYSGYPLRPEDPYRSGLDEDPNDYDSVEFEGDCDASVETTLYPTDDVDGDGQADWGHAGVYVVDFGDGNPYGHAATDALGPQADPALTRLRGGPGPVGENASYFLPEDDDGQLSRHRTHGPIEMPHFCPDQTAYLGIHHSTRAILVPAGSLDFGFESITEAQPSGAWAPEERPTLRDVDRVSAILQGGG